MNIIDYIGTNPEVMIGWVTEFFNGKYTRDEVSEYLYATANGSPRKGVIKLADEFNNLQSKDTADIKRWYTETDFYVFDLLPWNGCGMFKEKIENITAIIKQHGFKTIIDFGGGLGVTSIYLAQELNCKVYYVDLKDSITSKFAKFLMNKMNVTSVEMLTDEEFYNSSITADAIVSLDCFEHIPDMEDTFDKLTLHSNVIVHDSTFFSDQWSPQHVYTPTMLDFLNMCALRNYIPRASSNILWRVYLSISDKTELQIKFI